VSSGNYDETGTTELLAEAIRPQRPESGLAAHRKKWLLLKAGVDTILMIR
jgi:hypothetical protein